MARVLRCHSQVEREIYNNMETMLLCLKEKLLCYTYEYSSGHQMRTSLCTLGVIFFYI